MSFPTTINEEPPGDGGDGDEAFATCIQYLESDVPRPGSIDGQKTEVPEHEPVPVDATVSRDTPKRPSLECIQSAATSFSFEGISVTVKTRKKKEVKILDNVSGSIQGGSLLAVMGPSGSGKTTLMNVLSLQSRVGACRGCIRLDGCPLTGSLFKEQCYFLPQYDKSWAHLTCFQVLTFALKLFGSVEKEDVAQTVFSTLESMGLTDASQTKCSGLSGGQVRRLSLGVALLKRTKVLFLDEVTSGLDSDASFQVVQVLHRIAKAQNIMIVVTIHQPSTAVLEIFDNLLLLSKGKVAYAGRLQNAEAHFEDLGYPLPRHTNPSEHYLNLINTDFTPIISSCGIHPRDVCVDAWASDPSPRGQFDEEACISEQMPDRVYGSLQRVQNNISQVSERRISQRNLQLDSPTVKPSSFSQLKAMIQRHWLLIVKDPILYLGRCVVMLVTNSAFSLVYWNARRKDQEQAPNHVWLFMWWMTIPAMMGVIAVHFLHNELNMIQGEIKNGLSVAWQYLLTLPIVTLVFSLCALGIPMFVVQSFPGSVFFEIVLQWSLIMYLFESIAECSAAWAPNSIIGMLGYLTYWILSFLFGGIFLPPEDIYWPLKAAYYALPFNYYTRSMVDVVIPKMEYNPCNPSEDMSVICIESGNGDDVAKAITNLFPVTKQPDSVRDALILFVMIVMVKLVYIVGVVWKSRRVQKMEA